MRLLFFVYAHLESWPMVDKTSHPSHHLIKKKSIGSRAEIPRGRRKFHLITPWHNPSIKLLGALSPAFHLAQFAEPPPPMSYLFVQCQRICTPNPPGPACHAPLS